MSNITHTFFLLADQAGGNSAFKAGQIAGSIFAIVLIGAIIWKVIKKD